MKQLTLFSIMFVAFLACTKPDPTRYKWDTDENGSFCRDSETGKSVSRSYCQ